MEKTGLPRNAIGRYVTEAVPTVEADSLVETVHKQIFAHIGKYETINYVYVVNGQKKLVGVVSIKELVRAKGKQKLKLVMQKKLVTVRAHSPREKAVYLALQHSIKAVPVVDKTGKFGGVVPSDALLSIMQQEVNEDFFYLSGRNKGILSQSVVSQVVARVPWVLVGLGGGIISSSVIAGFEETLLQLVRLAAFIPVILNISGNVATQSAVLFVRELSLGRVERVFKALAHEMLTGVLIGTISGTLLGLVAVIGHSSAILGLIVGVSIVITQTVGALLGLLVPWLFKSLGKDPALGSGPVTTTLMDIVATSVYLTIAWGMLSLI